MTCCPKCAEGTKMMPISPDQDRCVDCGYIHQRKVLRRDWDLPTAAQFERPKHPGAPPAAACVALLRDLYLRRHERKPPPEFWDQVKVQLDAYAIASGNTKQVSPPPGPPPCARRHRADVPLGREGRGGETQPISTNNEAPATL